MTSTSSLGAFPCGEPEKEQLVRCVLSLWEQGMHGSTRLLGDLLLANQQSLGLAAHHDWHLAVLLAYADGLFEDLQYCRAVHYYKEAVKTLAQAVHVGGKEGGKLPTELDIKWKMYRCHVMLRQHQEALDTLSTIPLRQRNVQVAIALANLYKNFKNDSRCALICYRQALSMCPFAVEAIVGLLSLGMTLPEVLTLTSTKSTPHSSPITNTPWLIKWLETQEAITKHEFDAALTGFENLTKLFLSEDEAVLGRADISQLGISLSPDANCQLAWCLVKSEKKAAAIELFSKAQTQDVCVLSHMDTFARILTNPKRLEKLSSTLMAASTVHPEPWIAKAWQQTRNTSLPALERAQASVLLQNAYTYHLKNAEAYFCHASLLWAKRDEHSAVQKYQEAVHVDPSFFDAYEALVRCYLAMRRDREAINLARAAARHIKKPALQYYLQGIALSQKPATTDKCRMLLEKAVKTDATFQQAILQLGSLYLQEGALTNTVDLLLKHVDTCNTPLLHTELGSCLTRLKRYQEAMEHYSLALIQDPTYEKALQGMELLHQRLHSASEQDLRVEGEPDLEEDTEDIIGVQPLELDNPLEMDSDDDSIPVMDLPNQEYQW